jgi:hypothetical protein
VIWGVRRAARRGARRGRAPLTLCLDETEGDGSVGVVDASTVGACSGEFRFIGGWKGCGLLRDRAGQLVDMC